MERRHRLALAMGLCVLVAGCASNGAKLGPGESSAAGYAQPLPAPEEFRGEDCFGIGSFTYWAANSGPAGDEVPPGWEHTQTYDPALTSHYYVDVVQCQRFSGGPFERGPVTMLWESHTQANFPPDCLTTPRSDINDIEILVSLWIDDEAIATWLHDTYGIPTRVASFAADNQSMGIEQKGWKWHTADGPESSIYMPFFPADAQTVPGRERLFYHDGQVVTGLDWSTIRTFAHDFRLNQMYGTFESPMLHSESGTTTFAGFGGVYFDSSYGAEVQRYGDLECKEPLYSFSSQSPQGCC